MMESFFNINVTPTINDSWLNIEFSCLQLKSFMGSVETDTMYLPIKKTD